MVHIIVKPETLVFCNKELETYLRENGFIVIEKQPLCCWNELSIQLYKKSDKVTKRQLELQNIARKQLLGNMSSKIEVWTIQCQNNENELEQYSKLNSMKRSFRALNWIDGLTLRIEYKGESTIYHFTYFHVPDASEYIIEEEKQLLEKFANEMGVI